MLAVLGWAVVLFLLILLTIVAGVLTYRTWLDRRE